MIGTNIRAYLKENGIKQAYVAERAGIPSSQMSRICNGKRNIDCVTYYKICTVLNVPLDLFFAGVEI